MKLSNTWQTLMVGGGGMREIEMSNSYKLEPILGNPQMLIRTLAILGLFMPTIAMADHYLKNGSYMCELAWLYDGTQQKNCFTRKGKAYECLGYKYDLARDKLIIHRKGSKDVLIKISESFGFVDNGRHVVSMVFVNTYDGSHGSILTTLNFVPGEPNLMHLKTIKYDETAYRDITSDNIKSDPYLIKTFSYFSRCERLQ